MLSNYKIVIDIVQKLQYLCQKMQWNAEIQQNKYSKMISLSESALYKQLMLRAILILYICIAVNDFFSTGQCLVRTAIFLEVESCVHFCLISIGDIFIPINWRCVIIGWYSSTATIRKTAFLVYKTQLFSEDGSFFK